MSMLFSDPSIRDAVVPISVEQYRRMGEDGIILEKTELIRGVILRKMNKSPLHRWTVMKLLQLLNADLPEGVFVQTEQPLGMADSEPEPDISVILGSIDDFRTSHPATAELVVEVSITTEVLDRTKAPIYAEAEIAEYWLVLPESATVERMTKPVDGQYTETQTLGYDTVIELGPPLNLRVDLRGLA